MRDLGRLIGFVKPYWRLAVMALVMLTALVAMDLAIPRLVQQIIDQGIAKNDRSVVVETALAMLGISVVSTFVAIANNVFSVRVGEGVARDLREAHAVAGRVEEAPQQRRAARPRPAVQHQRRNAIGAARLVDMQHMAAGHRQGMCAQRRGRWVQGGKGHGVDVRGRYAA